MIFAAMLLGRIASKLPQTTSVYSRAALVDCFYASLSCFDKLFVLPQVPSIFLVGCCYVSKLFCKLLHCLYFDASISCSYAFAAAFVDLDHVGFGYTGAFVEDPMQDKHYHMFDIDRVAYMLNLRALALFLKEEGSIYTIMILFEDSLLLCSS
ncbi:hypothetical protein L1987_13508 [Smallanthus sonchifolius]|uniref:Uncharacterized protein n=1 Tax=Smallanthus sonchifolius TaxID=185202 RepID=A0ACB9JJ20_9ASTR|nr:hypothetical protein L1987_13508 [Smallanthus sonchifolius]